MNQIQVGEPLSPFGHVCMALDTVSDAFSERVAAPAIIGSFNAAEAAITKAASMINRRLGTMLNSAMTDPVSARVALKITQPIEQISLSIAIRKPTNIPFLHYVDVSIISSAQALHRFIKEANYLLRIPVNLRRLARGVSPGETVNKIARQIGKKSVFLCRVILVSKSLVLTIAEVALHALEFVLSSFLMEEQFGIISATRKVLNATRDQVREKFSDIADQAIEFQEKGIRKAFASSIAEGTVHWITVTFNRVALKSFLGGAAYLLASQAIEDKYQIPVHLIHKVAIPVIVTLIWYNSIMPILDPYYDALDHEYNGKKTHMREFLEAYSLDALYYPIVASRGIMFFAEKKVIAQHRSVLR